MDFDAREKCWNRTNTRACATCVVRRKCSGLCQELKAEAEFTPSEWRHANNKKNEQGKCRMCMQRAVCVRGRWRCQSCKNLVSKESYTQWLRTSAKHNGSQICDDCYTDAVKQPIVQTRQGYWDCKVCKQTKRRAEFKLYLQKHEAAKKHNFVRCDACERLHDEVADDKRTAHLEFVQKILLC